MRESPKNPRRASSLGSNRKRSAANIRNESVAIVGAGRLGSALALAVDSAGFSVTEILTRRGGKNRPQRMKLAKRLGAELKGIGAPITAKVILITVPDDAIRDVAAEMAMSGGGKSAGASQSARDPSSPTKWRGKIVLHASGALDSSVLAPLARLGAETGSAHPLNSFVNSRVKSFVNSYVGIGDGASDAKRVPHQKDVDDGSFAGDSFAGVSFAIEGSARARAAAFKIAHSLGGRPFFIRAEAKPLYHAFGALASPMLVALCAMAEEAGSAAGVKNPRQAMLPITMRSLKNFLDMGAARALSGPLVRGDAATIKAHLRSLERFPDIRRVYIALSAYAATKLPGRNKEAILELLNKG